MTFQDIFQLKSKKQSPSKKQTIIIDNREKNSLVPAYLKKLGFNIQFKQLKVADYLINKIAIERKTTQDLYQSMLNKRLFRQLQEIKQYPSPLLIIEGNLHELYKEISNSNAVKGFVLSIILKSKIPTYFSQTPKETAEIIRLLAIKKQKEYSLNPSKTNLTNSQQLQFTIESFPNIGPKKAKALLTKFKTIQNIITAEEKELQEILGKRAEDFSKIIKRKF